MKFLVVVAAFLAVASAAPEAREKRGIIGSTVVAGPSGTIIASPGLVSSGLLAPGLIHPGLVAPGLIGARSLIAPGLISGHGLVLANPGVTAGTVIAPGTTLIGPNTNGAPGAVITNGLLGPQILI